MDSSTVVNTVEAYGPDGFHITPEEIGSVIDLLKTTHGAIEFAIAAILIGFIMYIRRR